MIEQRDPEIWVMERALAIARQGHAVRKRTTELVAAASLHAREVAGGLASLVRATLTGAARGLQAAAPAAREDTLRQVVDGVGDGLATVAQAVELTLLEAVGDGGRFARQDLERLAREFTTLASAFADGVGRGLADAGAHVANQAKTLKDHAVTTLQRTWPMFASAAATARDDPIGLGQQAIAAGTAAARDASASLRHEIGVQLQRLGVALAGPRGAGDG